MANFRISNILARAMCDQVGITIDGGPAAGFLEFKTGAPPAECETADSGTLLATLPLSDPSVAAAVDVAPGADGVFNSITDDTSADNSGVVAHYRIKDSTGVVAEQGDVTATAGGGDIEVDDINFVAGAVISITSYKNTQPEA